jgi:hypothetical protein
LGKSYFQDFNDVAALFWINKKNGQFRLLFSGYSLFLVGTSLRGVVRYFENLQWQMGLFPQVRGCVWSIYPNWVKTFVSLDGLIICSMLLRKSILGRCEGIARSMALYWPLSLFFNKSGP